SNLRIGRRRPHASVTAVRIPATRPCRPEHTSFIRSILEGPMSYRFQPLLVVALVAAAACGTSNDAGETGETEELRLAGSPVESEAVPADVLARARATA